MALELSVAMGLKRYRDLLAWQLAQSFKLEVFRLVRGSATARRDFRFRQEIVEAARAPANDIAEGFVRKSAGTFAVFLDYAMASLAEAEEHLGDGIELGHFDETDCAAAFRLAKRLAPALRGLKDSQIRYAATHTLESGRRIGRTRRT